MIDEDRPADPHLSLAVKRHEERRAVEEAGGGVSEGFELAEQELIEHTSHGDEGSTTRIVRDAIEEQDDAGAVYGEADQERLPD